MRILICGDSFASYVPVEHTWYNLLAKNHNVTIKAQAAVSEYKILKQVQQENLDCYDLVIVCHTSPNRVHIAKHPVHNSDFYSNADFLYNDVLHHFSEHPDNVILETAKNYFEQIFDEEYYKDIYFLMRDKIVKILEHKKSIHITTLFSENFNQGNTINLEKICKIAQGQPNHYNQKDHKKIFNLVSSWIEHE